MGVAHPPQTWAYSWRVTMMTRASFGQERHVTISGCGFHAGLPG
jgi:hypothetical protein